MFAKPPFRGLSSPVVNVLWGLCNLAVAYVLLVVVGSLALDERRNSEVEAIISAAVEVRSAEWRSMVTRAMHRGEIPPETDPQLLLDVVGAILDGSNRSSSSRLDKAWLVVSVRTVIAGARAGTLVREQMKA